MAVFSLSAFSLLLLLAALISGLATVLTEQKRNLKISSPLVDLLWVTVLSVAGVMSADAIHTSINPAWYPVGQDWREFVVLALDIQSGGDFHPVPQRYPFYPWLAVQLAALTEVPLHISLMQVNLIAGGLIPAAIYRLGTAVGPRSLAVAGGWLSLHIPTVGSVLGPPTDYLLHGLVYILALSAGVRALRGGGPWRWLAFGLSLAVLMATTMKSLVFLLGAAPLVAMALIWRARVSLAGAALSLGLWLAPMMMIWSIYAGIPRWATEAYTLEYNVYRTQVVVARSHGRNAPMPTDLGWHPSDEKQRGYWGVGRPGAWTNLDKALTFLARGPKHNLDRSVRWQDATRGLSRALHTPHPAWMLLGLAGFLAPLRRRQTDTHLGPVLATAWVSGIMMAHFMGVMATHFIPRYALVLLIPAPLFLLLGVCWRRTPWLWLVPIASVVATTTASTMPGQSIIHTSAEVTEGALNPHPDFWAVRDGLTAADTVVDLTGNRLLTDLWASAPAHITAVRDERTEVSLDSQYRGRRILVMPGALNLGDPVRRWQGASPGRLKELRPYVFEDIAPSQGLKLSLTRLGE